METNNKKNQDQSQGKQSTAETDVTYNLDSEELRNSATTSQDYATSNGTMGSGGVMTPEDEQVDMDNLDTDK